MTLESYDDALVETFELLLSHNEQTGPVVHNLLERLRHDPELQAILLQRTLPADDVETSMVIRREGVPAVRELVNHAGNRIQEGYRGSQGA